MKCLIVDSDKVASELVQSRLSALGIKSAIEPGRNIALKRLEAEPFDFIVLDPAPMRDARPFIREARRVLKANPYMVLASESHTLEEAVKSGFNDLLPKPLDSGAVDKMDESARTLTELVNHLGDDKEDFKSSGGIIAKSAFNQLFLACIDRADRYAERSYLLFISLENYKEIIEKDGPYPGEFSAAQLAKNLVRLRRQSDIIGQTRRNEYVLLLQRPVFETEPIEAAHRFAEALSKMHDITSAGAMRAKLAVRLIDLPLGAKRVEHVFDVSEAPRPITD
jgi:CheY-like chemotaxis protein